MIGALVAALGLAGCGRKAGLDPPPSAAIVTPADGVAAADSVQTNNGQTNNGKAVFDPVTGMPVAPASVARKTHFLDFLVD
jgi:hypothetical protein